MGNAMSLAEDVAAAAAEVKSNAPEPAPALGPTTSGAGNQSPEPSGTHTMRARDEHGRFAPKAGDKHAEAVTPAPSSEANAAPEKSVEPAATSVQKRPPPRSWRPTVHGHWDKVPPEVQEEIYRVEGTTRALVQQHAQQRKQAEQWEQALAPYKPHIQGDPVAWVDSLARTAVQLQTAPPPQRAALVAQIIRDYGVPIDVLDEALSGAAPQSRAQQSQQDAPPEFMQHIQRLEADLRRMQYAPQIAAFEQKAEFLNEPMPDGRRTVRDAVALRLKVAAQEGVELTLQDAYDEVVARHPTIQEALKQREEAKASAERNARTAQAQAAASSVRSEPVVVAPEDGAGGSIFDDVMASRRALTRR